ncbi:MAG TPA: molybdopterin molybdotransferase MoeA [Planctomycetota bacterium]|jgi:molybdopterin molybdotransferase|nr:molybdopterin molybdotransferase MoeA [Planctomycetota bacterium]
MLTYADALARLAALDLKPATERIPLTEAAGRTTAEDITLAGDQPPFDRATMDGYALCLKADTNAYAVKGVVYAGSSYPGTLQPGEAVRIMTGAPAPAGTTVVPHELSDRGEQIVVITDAKARAPGRNIAWRGEDGKAGTVLVSAGTRLTPLVLSVAAMAGATTVTVARAPRLALVTTGDEVGGAGPAGIIDSNGPFLTGFAASLGLSAYRVHAVDQEGLLRLTLSSAMDRAEVIVTTGGVSAGDKDLIPVVAAELGFSTVFHHVAMQPGKPILVMRKAERFLVGLPGNPVSVVATAHLFLLPLLHRLLGAPLPTWYELPLTAPAANRGQRQQFLPARLTPGGFAPIPWNGSGDLIAAASGDGLIDLPVGTTLNAGGIARFLPYVGAHPGATGRLPERPRR